MSLRERYTDALEDRFNASAIWEPGRRLRIGSLVIEDDDEYTSIGSLPASVPKLQVDSRVSTDFELVSTGVAQKLFQLDQPVLASTLVPTTPARLELAFEHRHDFVLKSPRVTHRVIRNLGEIAQAVSGLPVWNADDKLLVSEVYEARGFFFASSEADGKTMVFEGLGATVLSFLQGGSVGFGLRSLSQTDFRISGASGTLGTLAVRFVRIAEDGKIKPRA